MSKQRFMSREEWNDRFMVELTENGVEQDEALDVAREKTTEYETGRDPEAAAQEHLENLP